MTDHTLYRNTPSESFAAHLFDGGAVESAGGGPGEQSDTPVASRCNQVTSYGAFEALADGDVRVLMLDGVEGLDLDICKSCLRQLNAANAPDDETDVQEVPLDMMQSLDSPETDMDEQFDFVGETTQAMLANVSYNDLRSVADVIADVPASGITEDELLRQLRACRWPRTSRGAV